MRKLRNRVRKMRAQCDWLTLDPLCETEASLWEPKSVLAQVIQIEMEKQFKKLAKSLGLFQYGMQGFKGIARSVAPAPQPVSKVQHNQTIILQGDYFLSDS